MNRIMCPSTPFAQCEFAVSHEAPALARQFLRSTTCAEHNAHVVEDAVLLVSELVTNSVLHGGPPVVVAAECDGAALRVRVRDGSPELPVPRSAGPDAEGGRGLDLVRRISEEWGVEQTHDGKHVWFVIR